MERSAFVARSGASLADERSPSAARAVERGAAKPRGRGRGQRNKKFKISIIPSKCNFLMAGGYWLIPLFEDKTRGYWLF